MYSEPTYGCLAIMKLDTLGHETGSRNTTYINISYQLKSSHLITFPNPKNPFVKCDLQKAGGILFYTERPGIGVLFSYAIIPI